MSNQDINTKEVKDIESEEMETDEEEEEVRTETIKDHFKKLYEISQMEDEMIQEVQKNLVEERKLRKKKILENKPKKETYKPTDKERMKLNKLYGYAFDSGYIEQIYDNYLLREFKNQKTLDKMDEWQIKSIACNYQFDEKLDEFCKEAKDPRLCDLASYECTRGYGEGCLAAKKQIAEWRANAIEKRKQKLAESYN